MNAAMDAEALCGCSWQRCVTHLQRDLQGHVGTRAGKATCADLVRLACSQEDPVLARAVWEEAQPRVSAISRAAGEAFGAAREDALAFMAFPREHWPKIRTNNQQERANREIKRRYRSVQAFPSRGSMMRLTCAVPMGEGAGGSRRGCSRRRRWPRRPRRSPSRRPRSGWRLGLYAAEAVRATDPRNGPPRWGQRTETARRYERS